MNWLLWHFIPQQQMPKAIFRPEAWAVDSDVVVKGGLDSLGVASQYPINLVTGRADCCGLLQRSRRERGPRECEMTLEGEEGKV